MANGMGSIYIGHSGLKASQDSIHNVANNLANVNTNGYVRQQVVFRDARYSNLAYSKNNYKKVYIPLWDHQAGRSSRPTRTKAL